MIKRANQKKKKGFSLIELIIVLAVMAIIALIAIPNFTAVRENSKVKADKQSCETIERTILMLTADETLKLTGTTGDGTIVISASDFSSTTGKVTNATLTNLAIDTSAASTVVTDALAEVSKPQAKGATGYTITVNRTTGEVTAVTTTPNN